MVKWLHVMTSDIQNVHLYNVFVWGGCCCCCSVTRKQLIDENISKAKHLLFMLLLFPCMLASVYHFVHVQCMHPTCIDGQENSGLAFFIYI